MALHVLQIPSTGLGEQVWRAFVLAAVFIPIAFILFEIVSAPSIKISMKVGRVAGLSGSRALLQARIVLDITLSRKTLMLREFADKKT